MTAMGSATQASTPTTWVASAFYATMPQMPMGSATFVTLSGGSTVVVPTTGITWPRTR